MLEVVGLDHSLGRGKQECLEGGVGLPVEVGSVGKEADHGVLREQRACLLLCEDLEREIKVRFGGSGGLGGSPA